MRRHNVINQSRGQFGGVGVDVEGGVELDDVDKREASRGGDGEC